MKIPSAATPPTTMPPMAPPLSGGEEFELSVTDEEGAALVVVAAVEVDEVAEVVELLGKAAPPVFEPPVVPFAVKFTYAAQLGLGSARGQVGSWQSE